MGKLSLSLLARCPLLRAALACFAAAGLLATDSAFAAQPIRGAAYFGFEGKLREFDTSVLYGAQEAMTSALRVSTSGRRLSGRGSGSYIVAEIPCRRDRRGWVTGVIPLAPRGRLGTRIRRDGRFSAAGRRGSIDTGTEFPELRPGGLRYRVHGHFTSPDEATLVYSVGVRPLRPRNRRRPGRCRLRGVRVAFVRNGKPPFRGCQSHQDATIVLGPTGRIFGQLTLDGGAPRYGQVSAFFGHIYACLFETNKRWLLGVSQDVDVVELVQLAGPYTAFQACYQACGQIKVIDLRDGKVVRRIRPHSPPFTGSALDLVLKENASVAWISGAIRSDPLEVWALDGGGRRMLDSGRGIDPRSLTLEDSTLRWLHSGQQREALLN